MSADGAIVRVSIWAIQSGVASTTLPGLGAACGLGRLRITINSRSGSVVSPMRITSSKSEANPIAHFKHRCTRCRVDG